MDELKFNTVPMDHSRRILRSGVRADVCAEIQRGGTKRGIASAAATPMPQMHDACERARKTQAPFFATVILRLDRPRRVESCAKQRKAARR